MAAAYLVLCVLLAVTLNAANRWLRACGTLLAALALFMISVSIILANFDGTFANFRPVGTIERSAPLVLDLQAGLGLIATAFLLWSAWAQFGRTVLVLLPMRNEATRFGRVSRYAHWITATLMLLLIPMGLFISVLPPSGDRASFLAAHQALGLTVLLVAAIRVTWLVISPPPTHDDMLPRQRNLARAAHIGLYALILAFPVTGFMMTAPGNKALDLYGATLPDFALRDGASETWRTLHDAVLPLVFYGMVFLHIGAVLKHHFADRRFHDIRRMLR